MRRPFRPDVGPVKIVHVGHHKVASVWFDNVLTDVAGHFGLSFVSSYLPIVETADEDADLSRLVAGDVVLIMHSRHFRDDVFAPSAIRGSHIVRDPRDVAVSGYRYHLWTTEKWVHAPRKQLGGMSYQQHLKSLPEPEGLLAEIEWTCASIVAEMRMWDYGRSNFLEMRYEDLIVDEDNWFERLFRHYGFTERAVESSVQIARRHSFRAKTGRSVGEVGGDSHLRSGKPGQWRAEFNEEHVALFKRLGNDVLVRLGYENDDSWTV
jgi:hypothetical protein